MLLVVMLGCAAVVAARRAAIASITGRVVDAAGQPLGQAAVSATSLDTGEQRSTHTDARGNYRFPSLPPGRYELVAALEGFTSARRDIVLRVGDTADVPFTLPIRSFADAVTVNADVRVVELSTAAATERVTPREIESLPLNGRNYLDLALLTTNVSRTNTGSSQRFAETSAVPGTGISVGGQRNLNNSFIVDGLSANDDSAALAGTFFSEDVIREFQVIASGGTAEFGRASAGTINIVTQSGTNTTRARGYLFARSDRFDARHALAAHREPLSQEQYGATAGGPLRRDTTFYFSNAERTHNARTGLVTIADGDVRRIDAVAPGAVTNGAFSTGFDTLNLFARIDRASAGGTRNTMRYSFYDVSSPNARNVGGLNAASRGTRLDSRDQTLALSRVQVAGAGLVHELRAQVTRSRLSAPPNDLGGPAVNISGVASFGTSTVSPTGRAADVFEVADSVGLQRGAHLFKTGADFLHNRVTVDFPGALQGVYAFGALGSYEAGRYITYQQAFGDSRQSQSNPNLGLFLQDEWRASDALTVNAGLRYDLQWLSSPIRTDTNNVSPRVGVAWAPGDRRTVVRVSGGLFYDRIPLRATSNALQRDGSRYRVAILPFDTPGAPTYPGTLTRFPEGLRTSITTIDPAIEDSSSLQVSAQVEHAVTAWLVATLGYQHLDAGHIIMSRNVNVPTLSAADAQRLGVDNLGRPDPRFANVSRYESIGRAEFDALTISAQLRRSSRLSARLSYTLSRAMDDAGNFFFSQPQDAANVHADWGPSDNDQRHRLTVSGAAAGEGPLRNWQLALVASYASALPFTPRTGTDRNNDTVVNDRPEGVRRNSVRGFDTATVDLRVTRSWHLPHAVLDVMVEGFNVLNRANYMVQNETFGTGAAPRPGFGRPTAAGDPRQVQLGIRVGF